MHFSEFIRQPYPTIENKWKIIVSIGLFITIFMLLFQPFGLQTYSNQIKYYILSGYGLGFFIVAWHKRVPKVKILEQEENKVSTT